jgi:hypothetical protein
VSAPEDLKDPSSPSDDAKPVSVSEPQSTQEPPSAVAATTSPREESNRGLIYWVTIVLVLLGIELFYYGSKGDIKVCVGKEGTHDFALIGQERSDQNRWKFPFCEDRVNLGLRSHFDELGRDAVKVACRRATLMHFKDEQAACNGGDKNWKRKVITKQILPWDRRFYRRLFLLDR